MSEPAAVYDSEHTTPPANPDAELIARQRERIEQLERELAEERRIIRLLGQHKRTGGENE